MFNLYIKTWVNTVKNEKFNCFGYVYDFSFKPGNWFQIADDTAIGRSSEEDNQLWINCFIKWCLRADISSRTDKCLAFSVNKVGTTSCQYCPYLIINDEKIPSLKIDYIYTYLVKDFNFGMDCMKIKHNIIDDT